MNNHSITFNTLTWPSTQPWGVTYTTYTIYSRDMPRREDLLPPPQGRRARRLMEKLQALDGSMSALRKKLYREEANRKAMSDVRSRGGVVHPGSQQPVARQTQTVAAAMLARKLSRPSVG